MTLSAITSGTLTGLKDVVAGSPPDWRINLQYATFGQKFDRFNITAQSNTQPVFISSKRINLPISGVGFYQLSADAGSTYTDVHSTDNMGNISGAIYAEVYQAILVKQTTFINTTNTTNAIPDVEYTAGMSVYYGKLRAHLSNNESINDTNHNTSQATLVIPLAKLADATSVVCSGLAEVSQTNHQARFRDGGPVPSEYDFYYSGALTIGKSPFSVAITSFATTDLRLNNGSTASGTVVMTSLRADMDFRRGGPVSYTFSGMFTGTVSFA